MRNKFKFFGIIAIVIVIGSAILACDTGGDLTPIDYNYVNFTISIPTADEEAIAMLNYLKGIKWFDDNGYTITLPNTSEINAALNKLRAGNSLTSAEETNLKNHFINDIYNYSDYIASYNTLGKALQTADELISRFTPYKQAWDFYIPAEYEVQLTLYGPGGSYFFHKAENTGGMLIKVNRANNYWNNGNFAPLAVVLHEIVHIGIETVIIEEYDIPQGVKERIVDNVVLLLFADIKNSHFPNYTKQNIGGDYSIDAIFTDISVLNNLPTAVGTFLGKI